MKPSHPQQCAHCGHPVAVTKCGDAWRHQTRRVRRGITGPQIYVSPGTCPGSGEPAEPVDDRVQTLLAERLGAI